MKLEPPELTDLAERFKMDTESFIHACEARRELARAVGDENQLIKEHIKIEVMRAAQTVFQEAYFFTAKVRPWRG